MPFLEALDYVDRRARAVDDFAPTTDLQQLSADDLVQEMLEMIKPGSKIAVAFETRDGDGFARCVVKSLSVHRGNVPLACVWIDKKLVKLPRLVLATQILQAYDEMPVDVDELVVACSTLDPEPIATIIEREIAVSSPKRVWVLALLSCAMASERLKSLVSPDVQSRLRIHPAKDEVEYGETAFHEVRLSDSPTIQQVPTHMDYPYLIKERMNLEYKAPEP